MPAGGVPYCVELLPQQTIEPEVCTPQMWAGVTTRSESLAEIWVNFPAGGVMSAPRLAFPRQATVPSVRIAQV